MNDTKDDHRKQWCHPRSAVVSYLISLTHGQSTHLQLKVASSVGDRYRARCDDMSDIDADQFTYRQ